LPHVVRSFGRGIHVVSNETLSCAAQIDVLGAFQIANESNGCCIGQEARLALLGPSVGYPRVLNKELLEGRRRRYLLAAVRVEEDTIGLDVLQSG
jgi:hypothetical protein